MNTLEWLLFMDDEEFFDLMQKIKSSKSQKDNEVSKLIERASNVRMFCKAINTPDRKMDHN